MFIVGIIWEIKNVECATELELNLVENVDTRVLVVIGANIREEAIHPVVAVAEEVRQTRMLLEKSFDKNLVAYVLLYDTIY